MFGDIKNLTFGYNTDIIQEWFVLYNIKKIYIIIIKYLKYKFLFKIIYNMLYS
jgi:hypothetical protein